MSTKCVDNDRVTYTSAVGDDIRMPVLGEVN